MKNMITSKKASEEKMLSKGITNTTALAEVAQLSCFVDLARRYN